MRAIFIISLLMAGCSKPAEPVVQPPRAVRFAVVGDERGAGAVVAAGTVALRRETSLGFVTAGRIARMFVDEGDTVAPGQLLAALDQTTVGSALASAEAERARATAEYRRSAALADKGWITRPRVESAQAAMRVAEANVRATGFSATNARIAAPGPGIVLARLAEPGQVVAAGTPVVVLGERAAGFILRIALADRDAALVTVGAPAKVSVDALGQELDGAVIEVAGRADPATGTFVVKIGLPAEPRLRSGQLGTARILAAAATGQGALTVPSQAVFAARAGDAFVYVLNGDRIRLRRVRVTEPTDSGILVTGGLRRGERVAVSGVDRLSDGERVRVVAR